MRTGDLPPILLSQMEGERPPHWFESDGCTWAYDYIGPHDLRPACMIHDWGYALLRVQYKRMVREKRTDAVQEAERVRAGIDRQFHRNLRSCGLGRFMSGVYYRRVRLHGLIAARYQPPLRRPVLALRWLWLAVSRYLPTEAF